MGGWTDTFQSKGGSSISLSEFEKETWIEMLDEIDIGESGSRRKSTRKHNADRDYEHCLPGQEWVRGYRDLLGRYHKGYCRKERTTTEVGGSLNIPGIGKIHGDYSREIERMGEIDPEEHH